MVKENKIDLKKESRQLLKEISSILPKFRFIDHLPVKFEKGKVNYPYDFVKLQDIRYKLSMVKSELQDYIQYKNKNGW